MNNSSEETLSRYTDLVDLARHCKQSFARQISTAVHHVEKGILVVAILQDTYHDMRMAILVDPDKREIADIQAVMLRYPFYTCPEAPESYRRLIGLKLFEPGTLKRIHELIPRHDGCTHLYAVLENSLRALFIGGGRSGRKNESVYEQEEIEWSKLTPEQRRVRNMMHPMLRGTCLSFSKPPQE
ncbi:DUF2889 domain-containing protein [Candidatus Sumerlaeota bacterium]|nr:DUF2889 domain-containing protein [Candidatus Sumerlaeota bacterium]MBI3735943.1 DUF2889 domain-containing protein [Candidatus Sumerlaeota bacterium]